MPGISRVAFSIFGVDIYWYAVMIVIGMIVGLISALFVAKKKGVSTDELLDFVIVAVPVAIIGARLYYMVFDGMPITEFFKFRNGGLAIYGGVIFGVLAVVITGAVKKYNVRKMLLLFDCLIVGLIVGQAFGRWGNFFNQEAHGALILDMNLQWFPMGVLIEKAYIDGVYYQNVWCYATFFYEFLVNIVGYVALMIFNFKKPKYAGLAFCGYFVWYGIGRTLIEGMRTDSLYFLKEILGETIRVSQVLSIVFIIAGLVGIYFLLKQNKKWFEKDALLLQAETACGAEKAKTDDEEDNKETIKNIETVESVAVEDKNNEKNESDENALEENENE